MSEPVWMRRDVVLAFHDRLLAEHGGAAGLRDEGLLDSALGRPRNFNAYGQPKVFDLAAAYAFDLVKNHPFIDGNKRIGFATAALFLQLNDERLVAPEVDTVLRTLALAAAELSEAEFAAWLKATSRRA